MLQINNISAAKHASLEVILVDKGGASWAMIGFLNHGLNGLKISLESGRVSNKEQQEIRGSQ
jgi:hypothetical protein